MLFFEEISILIRNENKTDRILNEIWEWNIGSPRIAYLKIIIFLDEDYTCLPKNMF